MRLPLVDTGKGITAFDVEPKDAASLPQPQVLSSMQQ
jgi:hypothetical protein